MSEAIKLLKELLDSSTPFYSAIELDRGFDGEEWAAKAKALVDAHDSTARSVKIEITGKASVEYVRDVVIPAIEREINNNDFALIKPNTRRDEEITGYQPKGEQPHDSPRSK